MLVRALAMFALEGIKGFCSCVSSKGKISLYLLSLNVPFLFVQPKLLK